MPGEVNLARTVQSLSAIAPEDGGRCWDCFLTLELIKKLYRAVCSTGRPPSWPTPIPIQTHSNSGPCRVDRQPAYL